MDEKLNILKEQIKESYGNVFWTYIANHKDAEILSNLNNTFKISQIFLSAITTSGIIGIMLSDAAWVKGITAVFGLGQTIFSTYLKNFNPEKKSLLHKNTADKLWSIREEYKNLLVDININEKNIKEIQSSRDDLTKRVAKIYENAPKTTQKGFKQASENIKKGIYSFTQEELDILIESKKN